MISIKKGAKPQVLTDQGDAWTAELLAILARGDQPASYQTGRYNRPEIKQALRQETHGKCAYCESKYGHVAYGDIEHISGWLELRKCAST